VAKRDFLQARDIEECGSCEVDVDMMDRVIQITLESGINAMRKEAGVGEVKWSADLSSRAHVWGTSCGIIAPVRLCPSLCPDTLFPPGANSSFPRSASKTS
jgi:hypothetical protein